MAQLPELKHIAPEASGNVITWFVAFLVVGPLRVMVPEEAVLLRKIILPLFVPVVVMFPLLSVEPAVTAAAVIPLPVVTAMVGAVVCSLLADLL